MSNRKSGLQIFRARSWISLNSVQIAPTFPLQLPAELSLSLLGSSILAIGSNTRREVLLAGIVISTADFWGLLRSLRPGDYRKHL